MVKILANWENWENPGQRGGPVRKSAAEKGFIVLCVF